MVRAAAKNHASVAIVTRPDAYPRLVKALGDGGYTPRRTAAPGRRGVRPHGDLRQRRRRWMGTVVADTTDGTGFPAWTGATWEPRRPAALRREPAPAGGPLPTLAPPASPRRAGARREMSYSSYVDADAACARPTTTATSRRSRSSSSQPVWDRRGRDPGRGYDKATRATLGLRRDHRHEPDGYRGDGRAHGACSPR